MEYEKKYNDLIARINEVKEKPSLCMKGKHHYDGYVETGIRDALDYIVNPESEDERIRKKLYHTVLGTSDTDEWFEDISKDKVLAYLEKQKEQKPTAEEVLIRAGLKPFKDGNQWCILAGDNIQEGVCGFGDTIEDALYEFLKDFCEQRKPAEWSEEDELMRDAVLNTLERIGDYGTIGMQKDWLKSLRPQPHWKPSEEQMGALNYAYCELFKRGDVGHNILGPFQSLIDTLRKL